MWPAGPRLRDRLAHGELEPAQLPQPLADQLLWLTGQLLVTSSEWAERQRAADVGRSPPSGRQQQQQRDRPDAEDWSDLETALTELQQADDCQLDDCEDQSETRTGSGDQLETVDNCGDQSEAWTDGGDQSQVRTSGGDQSGTVDSGDQLETRTSGSDQSNCPEGAFNELCSARARVWYHPSFYQFSVLQRAVRRLCDVAETTARSELSLSDPPPPPLVSLAEGALSLRPPALRRPRWEAELLTWLQQLVAALETAWRQTATARDTWRRLQTAGQLRSRQRATWGRMQAALPDLHRLTAGLLRLVSRELSALDANGDRDGDGDGDAQTDRRSGTRWVLQSQVYAWPQNVD